MPTKSSFVERHGPLSVIAMVHKTFDSIVSVADLHSVHKCFLWNTHWPLQTEVDDSWPMDHPSFPFDLVVSTVFRVPGMSNNHCILLNYKVREAANVYWLPASQVIATFPDLSWIIDPPFQCCHYIHETIFTIMLVLQQEVREMPLCHSCDRLERTHSASLYRNPSCLYLKQLPDKRPDLQFPLSPCHCVL